MDLAAFLWTVIAVIAGMTIWYAGFYLVDKAYQHRKYKETDNGL